MLVTSTVQEKGQTQLLSVNFGKQLAEAFEEGKLWTSLGYTVSKTIIQLQADSERLRLLRWRVEGLTSSSNQAGLLANSDCQIRFGWPQQVMSLTLSHHNDLASAQLQYWKLHDESA